MLYASMEQERIDNVVKNGSKDIMKLYMANMMIHDTNIDEESVGHIMRPIMEMIGNVYGALFIGLRDEYHEGYINKQDIIDYFMYIMMKTTEYVNMVKLQHEEIREYVFESIANFNTQAMTLIETELDKSEYERVFG